ncbi:MAG: hypothetical protein ACON43_04085, partial [Flavobacteriaceae bacterium]
MKIRYSLFFLIVLVLGQKALGQTTRSTPTFEDGVYKVGTLAELLWVAETNSSWTSSFVLTADIDATQTKYWDDNDDDGNGFKYDDTNDGTATGSNTGWYPIGPTNSSTFDGNFDGKDYTISNLTASRTIDYLGLFGYIDDGGSIIKLKNINLENIKLLNGSSSIYSTGTGGLAGFITNADVYVDNIYVEGNIKGLGGRIGGIVGGHYPNEGIQNCQFIGEIYGNSQVGGIVGKAANISYLVSNTVVISQNASITGLGNDIGGIVGELSLEAGQKILQNMFIGTIDAFSASKVGGIVGEAEGSAGTCQMEYNVAHGNIIGYTDVGGLVGSADDWEAGYHNDREYNILLATVTGTSNVDAIVGDMDTYELASNYYRNSIYNNENPYRPSSQPGLSQPDFNIKSKYTGYTYWNSTIFDDYFVLNADYYDSPIVKGTKFFANEDAFYVKNVRSSTGDGEYSNGDHIYVEVTFNKQFRVTGSGTPTLALNSDASAVANYVGPRSPSTISSMTFLYTVGSSDSSLDLGYTSSNTIVLNGVGIDDNADPIYNYAELPVPNFGNSLIELQNIMIDNVAPTLISLSHTASPSNRFNASDSTTVTATFSEAMAATPTITIGNGVTSQAMSATSSASIWIYNFNVSGWSGSQGTASVTVAGDDLAGNAYSGNDSITFEIDSITPTVTLNIDDTDRFIGRNDSPRLEAQFSENMASTPELSLDGSVYTPLSFVSSTTWRYNLDMSVYSGSDGFKSFTVSGTDEAGNSYTGTETLYFYIDTVSPTVELTDTDSDNILIGSDVVSITATFSDAMTASPQVNIGAIITGQNLNRITPDQQTPEAIFGQNNLEYLARKFAFSENGERLIFGSDGFSDGIAKVYEWDSSTATWTQMGSTFTSSGDGIGHSIDISDDGTRIAVGLKSIGAFNIGRIEVYEWNSGTSTWNQMGSSIDGTGSNSGQEFNVTMSGDGNVIAFGNPLNTGYIEVYEWDSGTSTWVQRGPDINESFYNTKFGKDVALSENGSRLVVGESSFYTNGGSNTNVGRVLVYDWDSGTSTWTLKGNAIVSPLDSTDDNFGEIVDITNDGNRLVISSRVSHATKQAIVYTYQWNELGEGWELINQFNGVAGEDFGSSVKLSNNGNQMILGAPAYSSGRGRVYNYIWSGTSWTAIGLPVEGISFSYLGAGVTISGDGNKIASGEWQNNENGTRAGKVEIFHLNRWNYNWDVDGGGSIPADGVYTATVTGTDISGNVYTGTDSITFVIETTNPTVTLVDTDDDN